MIARVFPRRTNATPTDELAFTSPPGLLPPDVDEVHVSVTFTYDLPRAELLAKEWAHVAPVKIGGPALGDAGGEFVPGRYLKPGYVITSRGCPNRCWFCSVWRREGAIRELPIHDGWNVLDSNLLACSESHVKAVFAMLARQPRRAEFTGGLEARLLRPWHAEALRALHPQSVFFAYDTPDDLEPLRESAKLMAAVEFPTAGHRLRCYVLCGYPRDTLEAAEVRCRQVLALGFFPMAMAYRDRAGMVSDEWRRFARRWINPWIVASSMKPATVRPNESSLFDLCAV